jgi:hypothetical protein
MPTETCLFCFRKFKNMQALRAHRTLSTCKTLWEESLATLSRNHRPDRPVVNPIVADAIEVDALRRVPSNPPERAASPAMDWEPGPENGIDDISVDREGVDLLDEMPDGEIVLSDPEGALENSSSSDGNEDSFSDQDDAPDSEDEGDEECDDSGAEEDPSIADDADVGDASVLDDQTCPVDENDEENIVEEYYPGAGKIHQTHESHFQSILKATLDGKGNLHLPFASEAELQLATWMHQSGLSMAKMDEFFKLKYVSMKITAPYCSSNSLSGHGSATLLQNRPEITPDDRTAARPRATLVRTRDNTKLRRAPSSCVIVPSGPHKSHQIITSMTIPRLQHGICAPSCLV